jgi:hypothetical protein
LYRLNGTSPTQIIINETNISWKYDRDNFKNTQSPNLQWMDHENGNFSFIEFCFSAPKFFFRTFSSVDASCWVIQIQKTMGKNFRSIT